MAAVRAVRWAVTRQDREGVGERGEERWRFTQRMSRKRRMEEMALTGIRAMRAKSAVKVK